MLPGDRTGSSYLETEQEQEVGVGQPLDLLEQVERQEGEDVVFGRFDGIILKGEGTMCDSDCCCTPSRYTKTIQTHTHTRFRQSCGPTLTAYLYDRLNGRSLAFRRLSSSADDENKVYANEKRDS